MRQVHFAAFNHWIVLEDHFSLREKRETRMDRQTAVARGGKEKKRKKKVQGTKSFSCKRDGLKFTHDTCVIVTVTQMNNRQGTQGKEKRKRRRQFH